MNISKLKTAQVKRGFTLVELLVVFAIIMIITSILFYNFRGNDYQVSLDGIAHSIDVSIRQAQVNATAVRGYDHDSDPATPETFDVAYGLFFANQSNENTNQGFINFAIPLSTDSNGSLIYSSNFYNPLSGYTGDLGCQPGDHCISRQKLKSGYKISSVCVSAMDTTCPVPSNPNVTQLTIIYRKASSTPIITDNVSATSNNYAEIVVVAPDNITKRTIRLWKNGTTQIVNN